MTIEMIFTKENLIQAARKVKKKYSAGIDGITAKDATRIIKDNYDDIYKNLVAGTYAPNKVILKEIPKGNGKVRPIAVATVIDRCIQGCLNNAIYPLYENEMSPNSYGYIKGRNCIMAVNKIKDYVNNGYQWIVKIDLSGCFNQIDQDKILYKLRSKINDKRVLKLINKYLKVTYVTAGGEYKSFIGCPQGSALSPLFANIVLTDIDNEFIKRGYAFVRYADDIVIAYKSEKAARKGINRISNLIHKYNLEINQEKIEIRSIHDGVDFLGFHIYMNKSIHIMPTNKKWHQLKGKIRGNLKNINITNQTDIIHKTNQVIRGWLNYYLDSEIRRKCYELDLFIDKELKKAEKRINHKIDRKDLINCHELYKKKRQLPRSTTQTP